MGAYLLSLLEPHRSDHEIRQCSFNLKGAVSVSLKINIAWQKVEALHRKGQAAGYDPKAIEWSDPGLNDPQRLELSDTDLTSTHVVIPPMSAQRLGQPRHRKTTCFLGKTG